MELKNNKIIIIIIIIVRLKKQQFQKNLKKNSGELPFLSLI